MDPNVVLPYKHEERMDEILRLTRENHDMLRSIRSHQRWAAAMRIVYWLVIIGLAFGSWLVVEPYLQSLLNTYASIEQGLNSVNAIQGSIAPSGVIDKLKTLINTQ